MISGEKVVADPEQTVDAHEDRRRQSKRRKRARVTVFANWCKGCGLCVAFCPQKVFEEDEEFHPIVAYPERCTGCNWCSMHCPDFAIVVHVEDEPEGGDKAHTGREEEDNE